MQELGEQAAGVAGGEDADDAAVLRHERRADVAVGHGAEHAFQRLGGGHGVGVEDADVAHEELVFRRQAEVGIERAFHVTVAQHAHQGAVVRHRQVVHFAIDHEAARLAQRRVVIDHPGAAGHHIADGERGIQPVDLATSGQCAQPAREILAAADFVFVKWSKDGLTARIEPSTARPHSVDRVQFVKVDRSRPQHSQSLTIKLRKDVPVEEQLALLPFRVSELSGFKTVRMLAPNGAAVLIADGAEDGGLGGAPYMVVSLAPVAPGPNDDRGRLAQQLAASIPGIKDARIVNSEAVRIGGSPGYEVRVEATAVKEDKPITVVQWLRFGTGSTLRIVAGATRDDWPQAFPRFRAVRDGIGPKEK